MNCSVASAAERDKVFLGIWTELSARLDVMNLQLGETSAKLAPPAVARQDAVV